MTAKIQIVDGPVRRDGPPSFDGAGAVIEFLGVVRSLEGTEPIEALGYETYEPMAERELERIALGAIERHRLIGVQLWHSRGRVPAGQASLRVIVAAERRKAALAATDELIDELKRDVPIWKCPCKAVAAEGASHEQAHDAGR